MPWRRPLWGIGITAFVFVTLIVAVPLAVAFVLLAINITDSEL